MRRVLRLTLALGSIIALGAVSGSVPQGKEKQQGTARGRYLVEEVARCWECHTPRDRRGQFDRAHWLQGGPIWFAPIHPLQDWAYLAPPIAGLGGFTDDQMLQVLEVGVGPDGRPVRPPMHAYHLSREDATAIIDYLKSFENSAR